MKKKEEMRKQNKAKIITKREREREREENTCQ